MKLGSCLPVLRESGSALNGRRVGALSCVNVVGAAIGGDGAFVGRA